MRAGKPVSVSCNQPCAVIVRVMAGGRRVAGGQAHTNMAGIAKVRLRVTPIGRRLLKSHRSLAATLQATVTGKTGSVKLNGRIFRT